MGVDNIDDYDILDNIDGYDDSLDNLDGYDDILDNIDDYEYPYNHINRDVV